jgi:hypothetical protein
MEERPVTHSGRCFLQSSETRLKDLYIGHKWLVAPCLFRSSRQWQTHEFGYSSPVPDLHILCNVKYSLGTILTRGGPRSA